MEAAPRPKLPNYPVVVFWSDADNSFIADFPDLEYCSAFGPTPEAAIREAVSALTTWVTSAEQFGDPMPAPSSGEAILEAARASGETSPQAR